MKLCKRCNQLIIWNQQRSFCTRWQEQTADHHSSRDECIRVMSDVISRIEQRLSEVETSQLEMYKPETYEP